MSFIFDEKKDDGDEQPQEAQDQSTRKSTRERVSTTITIDGHTVLTKNNYIVTASEYISNPIQPDDVISKPKKIRGVVKEEKKYLISEQQIERNKWKNALKEHNNKIKHSIENIFETRWRYFYRNRDILEPFLNDKVKEHLKSFKVEQGQDSSNEDDYLERIISKQPELVVTNLRDYQMVGLNWMVDMDRNGLGMILGDEMGLGKTLQTISLIAYLKDNSQIKAPSLVICPLSVLYSWCNEIIKHAPSLKHFRLHSSSPTERQQQVNDISMKVLDYDIIITTYEMTKTKNMQHLIRSTYFNYVVLDEGHIIKGADSLISEQVRKFHSRNKLILTGTPLQNNLVELHSILNYLYPDLFTDDSFFRNAFDITRNVIDKNMLLYANKVLNLFMLRRYKEEVERLMPKKIETKIMCPLSTAQIFWYKGCLMKDINALVKACDDENDKESGGIKKTKYDILRNLIMQLRKCCLHPFLFDGAEGNIDETTIEELIRASGKLAVLDKLLQSLFRKGNRTVIFSQFTSMLDILEDYCMMRGWKYVRFDGGTQRAQRNYLINQFNAPESEIFIFLMSTRSGGLGINLQTADTCILFDSDWNPQPDIQAMARVHRIGQKKIVHVYRLVSAGTVEERILQRAQKKLYLDQMVNSRKGTAVSQELCEESDDKGGLSASVLLSTLKFGSNAVFNSSNDLPTEQDIDVITDRDRSEDTSSGLLVGGTLSTAHNFDVSQQLVDTQTYEGIDFRQLRDSQTRDSSQKQLSIKGLKEEWHALMSVEKRQRKNRILKIADCNGTKRDVLSINNYNYDGEPSIFAKETIRTVGMSNPKRQKSEITYLHQDMCQVCGYGGELIMCPRCPISIHSQCCGMTAKSLLSCSHHRCCKCGNNADGAGGLLFACNACPGAYCEDCLPKDTVRFLGTELERFTKLGFEGSDRTVYIHCSEQCENVAKLDLNWKQDKKVRQQCPADIDVSYAFGRDALSLQEIAKRGKITKNIYDQPSQSKDTPSVLPEKRVFDVMNNIPRFQPNKSKDTK